MQHQIKKLTDHALLDEVKILVRKEKELVAQVIEFLKEIEARKLHLARGYASMFAFATDFLGYSESEAHIRIQAARLTQALPEVKTLLESGEMSLSVAASAQSHFRKENLRRKEAGKPMLSLQEKREVIELVSGHSRREAEQNLNIHFAQEIGKRLSFEATPELLKKIERLMDLMAHKNFDRDLGKMVELLIDGELTRYEKRLKLSKPCVETSAKDETGPSPDRYISRMTRALVWAKNKGRCTYQDPLTGKKCSSTHGLEVDHKLAVSKGGQNHSQNLTLLCRSHNNWKSARLVE